MRVLDDGLGGLGSDQAGEVELWGFVYFRCHWSFGDFGSFGSCDLCFSCASCLYSLRSPSSMAKDPVAGFSFRRLCSIVSVLCAWSSISFIYWCHRYGPCYSLYQKMEQKQSQISELLSFPSAWNQLAFSSNPPPKLLKIALFVKKWPHRSQAGGLERHALTLHLALAKRGHELHIFTTSPSNSSFPRYPLNNLCFHLSKPTASGYLDQALVWKLFQTQSSTGRPFDVIHTESVGLLHTRSRNQTNLAVTWHGIAYETIHSDIIQELLRSPEEPQGYALAERVTKVVEEVRFFPSYAHHVATSDHVGDVLKRIYMIPDERVHIILNGVDEEVFKPDIVKGKVFKKKFGVPESKTLVLGMAGRLVKDKGHPLMFEALKQMLSENEAFRQSVVVLVAGNGPWGARYRDLGSNVLVLGPLEQAQLADFYNAIDIFVNPTLRAQGLDHTLLEAMLSGKPVMATRLASITGSVVVGREVGYTFSPTIASLKKTLYRVWDDGRGDLKQKGQAAKQRGLQLFTATKMAAAYERLFLCLSNDEKNGENFCQYQTPLH
ncbi:uncharacterized protein LOC133732188 isoform X1 [Rosa rugosa]|uniref:uncharacterized protein LOC133732188 isoform X1 n=2 Tax=Rosa rugosa TaxID=74645 RepID=UPI002B40F816|nr:uncharacterized protein LOC133732188 isoform X1 [Rosa rugosa]